MVGPEMQVGQLGVRPPQDDEPRVPDLQRIETLGCSVGHLHTGAHRWSANRPHHARRPQPIPESFREAHCEKALIAGIAVGHDRLGAVAIDDLVEPYGDLGEGVVPRDLLEPAFTLRTDSAERMEDSLVAVHPVEELVDLRAQFALAVRMIGIATHLQSDGCRPAAVDRDVPTTRIGAVMMATAGDDLGRGS